jgi:hypothetical protein
MPDTIESIQAKMANTTGVQAQILQIIQRRPGERNAITDVQICEVLGRSKGYERTVRDAIRTMRKSGIPICSASGVGYHWPEDFGDIDTTVAELRSRAEDMWHTAKMIEDGAANLFGGQRSF